MAPAPQWVPRYVLVERGDTMQRMFQRYLDGVETVAFGEVSPAISELRRSPAQALIVNASPVDEVSVAQLGDLPYGTPAITCWVPGEDQVAQRLGVVCYLLKPVSRESLLSTLASLGDGVRTVLLVDDEPDALQLFARMLSMAEHGYRVLRAEGGQRALALLRERQPDVMLLDLMMPEMDGFQVLREKSLDPRIRQIPVVVISSRDPTGEPIVSSMVSATRGGGLSAGDLLACIQALSEALSPNGRVAR
jgi:CheY-like chemotaxis protein